MTLNVLINKYGDPNWKRQCGDGFHKQNMYGNRLQTTNPIKPKWTHINTAFASHLRIAVNIIILRNKK